MGRGEGRATRQKAGNQGDRALTDEERIVLAVTALEEEVNGGFDQFLRNESRKFAPIIVASLRRIGCNDEAKITARALRTLHFPKLTERTIDAAMAEDDQDRDDELKACDRLFYETQRRMAERLYAFIRAHREQMRFP